MPLAALTDRAVLAVSGEDARAFLQGLITNDIHKATPQQAIFAALLTPQGRFMFDFFIIEHEGKLLLETDKARLPDLKKRLTMYRLRSKVEFAEVPELKVGAAWDEASGEWQVASSPICYADPRLPELGTRWIMNPSSRDLTAGMAQADYEAHRIALAVPEGSKDLTYERSIILEYGYDELSGVDFTKGCYVGQEVTARSKHRATLRKFIHHVSGEAPLLEPGTPVLANGVDIGAMCSAMGGTGLAHLRVEAAAKGGLTARGKALRAALPPWCTTAFAADAK